MRRSLVLVVLMTLLLPVLSTALLALLFRQQVLLMSASMFDSKA